MASMVVMGVWICSSSLYIRFEGIREILNDEMIPTADVTQCRYHWLAGYIIVFLA